MAKPELGSKRQCQSCGAKFFDLNRDPIICPKCGATFVAAAATRASARPAAAAADDEADVDPVGPEIVSLDDAAADEEKVAAVVTDDIEIEDDDAADETFLEEEEEDNDDVSDLIDSDLEDDEES